MTSQVRLQPIEQARMQTNIPQFHKQITYINSIERFTEAMNQQIEIKIREF